MTITLTIVSLVMKCRYLLKKKDKRGQHQIYLALYQNDEVELIYTQQRSLLKEWSENERAPKNHKSEVFLAIEKIKREVQKTIQSLESRDRPVTPLTVKVEYRTNKKIRESEQKNNDAITKEGLKSVPKLADNWTTNYLFRYKESTQKSVKESINQFVEYLKKVGLSNLEKKDLNKAVITDYERYLQEKKRLSNSTHGKRMKHLRWFLKSLNYDIGSITIRSHKKEIIALSLEELQKLEKLDVSNSVPYQKAKDMFLLGCYTGLRISDLKRIDHTRIIDGSIRMTLRKNNKEVSIPILPETKEILDRYEQSSPKISEQHLNKDIKEVCRKAAINKDLTIKINKAGRDMDKVVKKFDLITSHTASKTFITLAPKKFGLTPAEIAAVVGKDLKTLINHYFQLPMESAVQKMKLQISIDDTRNG